MARAKPSKPIELDRGHPGTHWLQIALGGFHRVATKQVKRIGAALARHQGSDERVEQVSRMVAILIIF